MGARKYIDCRLYESDVNCTVTIMADTEEELLSAAVEHAVAVHKHRDSPGLRINCDAPFRPARLPPK
jgi:predicted small metal-binding protein